MLAYWTDIDRAFSEMDEWFERALNRYATGRADPGCAEWAPRVTLEDSPGKVAVRAEIPGVAEKDIQVTVHDGELTLSGERKIKEPEGYSTLRRERVEYRFTRSVALPAKVDPEKSAATLKDGVLTVTLDKVAEAQPRRISVKAA